MITSDDDLRARWRQFTPAAAGRAGCLTDDEWAALLSQDVKPASRARAAKHIASCAQCADEYRLLEPLKPWVEEAVQVLSPGRRAGRDTRAPVDIYAPVWRSPRRTGALLVAASLAIVLMGAGLYRLDRAHQARAARFEEQLAAQRHELTSVQAALSEAQAQLQSRPPSGSGIQAVSPLVDVPIIDLDPENSGTVRGAVRGTGESGRPIALRDARIVTFILNFPPLTSRTPIAIVLADARGETRWSARTTRESGTASLNLTLQRESFPVGEYEIRLSHAVSGRTIATYRASLR
jgi:hypothetical protein